MYNITDRDDHQKVRSLNACIMAGSGFGFSLGILFGAAFENVFYIVAGVLFGGFIGLAIGKSLEDYQKYTS